MLAAVDLNYQPGTQARDVGDVRAKRDLSTKVRAVDGKFAEFLPKTLLRDRGVCPQPPRISATKLLDTSAHCHPTPAAFRPPTLPLKGRVTSSPSVEQ